MDTTPPGASVSGPLAAFAPGFAIQLTEAGYAAGTATQHVRLLGQLSRWLESQRVGVEQLSESRSAQFLKARAEAGYATYLSQGALAPLLNYLRSLDAIPAGIEPSATTPVQQMVEAYRDYVMIERGLSPLSVKRYEDAILGGLHHTYVRAA